VIIARTIAARLHLRDLVSSEPKKEEILRADFLTDFHVRSVERANGQRAIERKFHVAGAARFFSRSGNLFRQIGGGIDEVGVLDIEVR
jgi:hypothetical protein